MTPALAAACPYPGSPFGSEERPSTLDELISSAWERLVKSTTEAPVRCPVCGGQMKREHSAGGLPIGGRCEDCSSMLS